MHTPTASRQDRSGSGSAGALASGNWRSARSLRSSRRQPPTIDEGPGSGIGSGAVNSDANGIANGKAGGGSVDGGGAVRTPGSSIADGCNSSGSDGGDDERSRSGGGSRNCTSDSSNDDEFSDAVREADRLAAEYLTGDGRPSGGGGSDAAAVSPLGGRSSSGQDFGAVAAGDCDPLLLVMRSTDSLEGMALRYLQLILHQGIYQNAAIR